ncbi:MAG TPA: YicC family protein [Candidatus Mailhella merdavium]|nr:YicC family protein [Candidatus Mailhella merdavium]
MTLCSMTGYGRSRRDEAQFIQQWEIRSVNGRFLDLKWKLPSWTRSFEAVFEKKVRTAAQRGRVEVSLQVLPKSGMSAGGHLDTGTAAAMLADLEAFAAARGDSFRPDYTALLSLPHLWQMESEKDEEEMAAVLEQGLSEALEDWQRARISEARALSRDIEQRISQMTEWVKKIEVRAPVIKEERFALVRERLEEALKSLNKELDEGRYLQEIVIMADKLDVSEELTRLRAHLERLGELLRDGSDAGRKLDFTLQECFREINTCGNKIQDVAVSRMVVDFKNELEKCREQVQNLE